MNREAAAAAVSALFEEWYPYLLRYAVRVCGSVTLAEEAVQEGLLALYEWLQREGKVENPRAWTLCVVRRKLGLLRTADERARLFGGSLEVEAEPQSPDYRMLEALEWDELSRMFSRLTLRESEVLLLRLQPMRYGEIAAALGITKASVGTLLMRAVRKLREGYGVAGPAGSLDWDTEADGRQTLQ